MPRFVVDVSDEAFDRLTHLADQRRRTVKGQAAWLLEQWLANNGDIRPDEPIPSIPVEAAGVIR